jgi:hypothetical protein
MRRFNEIDLDKLLFIKKEGYLGHSDKYEYFQEDGFL